MIEDGERIVCGLDVGGSRAATALVWVTEDLRVGVETWDGEEAVIYAEAALRDFAEQFDVREVAFDPWRFGAQAHLPSRDGLRLVQSHSTTRGSFVLVIGLGFIGAGALAGPGRHEVAVRALPAESVPDDRGRRSR